MNEPISSGDFVGHADLTGIELPLGRELTDRLLAVSRSYCDSLGGCHGIDHIERVHQTALYIGKEMGARTDIISAAALLHDMGRREETRQRGMICHATHGAEIAVGHLINLGFSAADIEAITHCIATHRYRDGNEPDTLEAKILFDADKLDSIGAIGIGRAFLFAGQVGAKLHNCDSKIDNTRPYTTEDTAYREFKVKMSKIKDRMFTPIGRRLAEERHAFMELFFARLEREIIGASASKG